MKKNCHVYEKNPEKVITYIIFLSGCAISMIMVNTSGQVTDVVNESQTTKTDVSPKLPGALIP